MAIDRSKERMRRVTEPLFNFNVEKVGPLNKQGSPIYMHEGKPHVDPESTIPGQSISESGHISAEDEPHKSKHATGPVEGDLIRGEHLEYKPSGRVEDFDYKVQFVKDTSDVDGPYKIWKTTGIK